MRPIRQWLLRAAVVVALMLTLAQVASADPGDGGVPTIATATARPAPTTSTATLDPGDGGVPGE